MRLNWEQIETFAEVFPVSLYSLAILGETSEMILHQTQLQQISLAMKEQ